MKHPAASGGVSGAKTAKCGTAIRLATHRFQVPPQGAGNLPTAIKVICHIPFFKTTKGENMANTIELPSNWVCDGKELKPKSGASSSNTWIFDGKEIKPKTSASSSNTWIWDGKELKPKTSASSSNTWVIDGQKVKPKTGSNSSNTFEIGRSPVLVVAEQLVLRLW